MRGKHEEKTGNSTPLVWHLNLVLASHMDPPSCYKADKLIIVKLNEIYLKSGFD